MPEEGEITRLLIEWRDGKPGAFEDLMPLVYPHLRQIAGGYIRRERNPDLMQATSLVHELYLRLLSQKRAGWEDRTHFYTFAAMVMRMILIDHARENLAQRRGGGVQRVPLSDDLPWVSLGGVELIELNRAIDELNLVSSKTVRMLELRYFLGCTSEETADLLQISKATVDRDLKFARTWLYRRLDPTGGDLQ